jgi:hypothetical protein
MNPTPASLSLFRTCGTFTCLGGLIVCLLNLLFAGAARGSQAADYAALTAGIQGQSFDLQDLAPSTVAMFGSASFPLVFEEQGRIQAIATAGRYGGSYAASAARAVAFAHTEMFHTTGGVKTRLFSNAVLWASRQLSPAGTVVVVVNNSSVASFLAAPARGYTVRQRGTSLSDADLAGAHVLVLNGHAEYSNAVMTRIANFTAGGGGLVFSQTAWAASAEERADGDAMLEAFGLVMNAGGPNNDGWTVPSAVPSGLHSALAGLDALVSEKEGTVLLSDAERKIAIDGAIQVFEARMDIDAVRSRLDLLSQPEYYGLVAPTAAAPLDAASRPVERMLLGYQSRKFDALPPGELFVHPCAADFPGLPEPGAVPVNRTLVIDGTTSASYYMNERHKPFRRETGLYAPPGQPVTIRIPLGLASEGLQVHISANGSEDVTFDVASMRFFPKLWRKVPLASDITQTGSVLGGLITILVPAGKSLGNFNVSIEGAIEAPAFVLGSSTDEEWNSGVGRRPAPYGYIQTPKLTIYVPKWLLASTEQISAVAGHWKRVMDIMDEYSGYGPYRKRGEAIATAGYVSAGAAYAGYPIENGWGIDRESMLESAWFNGEWGSYHELGHTFQFNFDDAFNIDLNFEVDVNLFPGMVYAILHDRTAYDGPTHETYDAATRSAQMHNYLSLEEDDRTWEEAHSDEHHLVAYDFYFNLAEAFGWEVYRKAFTRLMRYLQNPSVTTDAELHDLQWWDPNFKRNRFYLLMCGAAQRNLDAYFQRYGLGVPGKGYEITQTIKNDVEAKGYPAWIDNTPIDSLSNPGTLTVREDLAPGTEIYQFVALDAEEPGTIWDYEITNGNINGAFSIDRRTGRLRVQKLDAETLSSYALTVEVRDNGVPRFSTTQTFTVNVTNVVEAPQVEGRLFKAASTMSSGASLGVVMAIVEPGRSIRSFAIVAGDTGRFLIHPATGELTLGDPTALPNPGVVLLTIRVEDSSGAVGFGKAAVLCNRETGAYQERWSTGRMLGNPTSTSHLNGFSTGRRSGDLFVRRVTGWIVPQTSGAYRFWVAADDFATVSISSDEQPGKRIPACSVASATPFQTWNRQATQKSQVFYLKAGHPYYIRAHHREVTGDDYLSVAWEGPGIARQVIPASALIPGDATQAFPSSELTPLERWRIEHFAALAGHAGVVGHLVDYDRDGRRNLIEYALGTHPGQANEAAPWQVKQASNRLAISFQHNRSAVEATLIVQGSDDLNTWTNLARSVGGVSFTPLVSGVTIHETGAGMVRTVEVRDRYSIGDPARPRRFLRLVAEIP